MNIAIIGAGAMGLLYAAYLSQENQVTLLCTNQEKADLIQEQGVTVTEKDKTQKTYHPKALLNGSHIPDLDVVILFVKSTVSQDALEANKTLVGPNTTLLTLQNGAGHEDLLLQFAKPEQIAIGISQDGSLLLAPNQVQHTGNGNTYFGKPMGDTETLAPLEETCNRCGFRCEKSSDIHFFIWEKLMVNASSSVVSGVFAMEQGYCYENPYAWAFVKDLVAEMIAVAKADGVEFDYDSQIKRLETHLTTNAEGVPSICVDLRVGRQTEVDSISGSVVKAGKRLSVPTPTHDMIVRLVHGLEGRKKQ